MQKSFLSNCVNIVVNFRCKFSSWKIVVKLRRKNLPQSFASNLDDKNFVIKHPHGMWVRFLHQRRLYLCWCVLTCCGHSSSNSVSFYCSKCVVNEFLQFVLEDINRKVPLQLSTSIWSSNRSETVSQQAETKGCNT